MVKKLMYLARHEDPELMKVFDASFEGEDKTEETFDLEFFLENARGILEEEDSKEEKKWEIGSSSSSSSSSSSRRSARGLGHAVRSC